MFFCRCSPDSCANQFAGEFSLLFIDNSFQIPAKLVWRPGKLPVRHVRCTDAETWRSPHVHASENPYHRFAWRHRWARSLFIAQSFTFQHYLALTAVIAKRRINTAHYGIGLLIDFGVELFIVSSFSRCEPSLLKPLIISYVIFIYCKASTHPTRIFYYNSTRKWLTKQTVFSSSCCRRLKHIDGWIIVASVAW